MSHLVDLLTEFTFLEEMLNETSIVLAEASLRLEALKERGPLITPNLQEWVDYVQDLETNFDNYVQMLSNLLAEIHWNGQGIPSKRIQWSEWFESVRKEIILFSGIMILQESIMVNS